QLENLIRAAELNFGSTLDKYSKAGKICIPIKGSFYKRKGTPHYVMDDEKTALRFDLGHPSVHFLANIKALAQQLEENGDMLMDKETAELKEAVDSSSLESLTYERYPIGRVNIKNIACVYGNTFTQI